MGTCLADLLKLNLGCGLPKSHKPGWVNVDSNPVCRPDILLDIATGRWPWANNSVGEAVMDNLAEHIGWDGLGRDLLCHALNEAHRVLSPLGVMFIRVPDAQAWFYGAVRDPTHRRLFVPGSFDYWNYAHQTHKNYGRGYGYLPWHILSCTSVKAVGDQVFIEARQSPIK